ncbi:ATP-binding protein [Antribacter gilvus]|uniref:ATP-binding protein n=1 Tax=Antribacter gilvus TaxID=2304675 RepID=UPI000F7AF5EB|nr:SbcC/MukB-like Walker B domain-containing protein [Antribacter gilvus]
MTTTTHPGQWRLARVEVVNWGTFSGHHRVDVAREGFLVTGHSGSGKSSLVDAVAAVLTPPARLRFNAAAAGAGGAAGGEAKAADRDVLGYVRGAWRHRTDEATGEVVADHLRPGSTWSGVLLRYEQGTPAGEDGTGVVTLVTLFRVGRTATEVEQLHVLLADDLGLLDLEPFARSGLDAAGIASRWPGAGVTDRHRSFAAAFTQALGIEGENALVLLHRTQSAKNLGSLDDLFRGVLDEPRTFDLAEAAVEQFGDLAQAHAQLLEARRQEKHLARLVPLARAYDEGASAAVQAAGLRGSLETFKETWKLELARTALADARQAEDLAAHSRDAADTEVLQASNAHQQALLVLQTRGGQALATQGDRLARAGEVAALVRNRRAELAEDLADAGLDFPASFEDFAALRATARRVLSGGDFTLEDARREVRRAHEARAVVGQRKDALSAELAALRDGGTAMGAALLAARAQVCEATGLSTAALPFAGELLRVRSFDAEWQGAAERVLRPLATTLLVPAAQRDAVAAALDATDLGTRLEVEVVGVRVDAPRPAAADSLIHKVEVKDGPMAGWLHRRLSDQYDYRCVASLTGFDLDGPTVTLEGLVAGGDRLVKDDTTVVGDPATWVLGWDGEDKLDHLLTVAAEVEAEAQAAEETLAAAERTERTEQRRRTALRQVERRNWPDVDIDTAERFLVEAQHELDALLNGTQDLASASKDVGDAERWLDETRRTAAGAADVLAEARAHRRAVERVVTELGGATLQPLPLTHRTELERRYQDLAPDVTHETIDDVSLRVARGIDAEREAGLRSAGAAEREIVALLGEFRRRWPAVARDLTDQVNDRSRYLAILEALRTQRVPALETTFLGLLANESQRDLERLAGEVRRAGAEIRERITPVNASLLRSPFDAGRYLQIRVKERRPAVVDRFLTELDALSVPWALDDMDAAERSFAVLERLMRRLGSAEPADRAWRTLCLDTRRHVRFTGVEVNGQGMVLDVHDSSAGLSGGQRQKLVVFCLAAALRYQLAPGEDDVPAYGSVILDEAFDKADTEFTRTAMDVFRAFGFHMILATPLKLLQTLEDYVGGVGLATCRDFRDSRIDVVELAPVGGAAGTAERPAARPAAGAPSATDDEAVLPPWDDADADVAR